MAVYTYSGPVYDWDRCVEQNWKAETTANSPSQARNQLTFRYKKETNRVAYTKIKLDPKKIKLKSQ